MPTAWCAPCRARGRTQIAHRLVQNAPGSPRIPKCADCYRNNVPVQLTEQERAERASDPPGSPHRRPEGPILPIGRDHPETHGPPLRSHTHKVIETDLRPEPEEKPMKETDGRRSRVDWTAVQRDRSAGMKGTDICEKYGISSGSLYTKTSAPPGGARKGRPPRVAKIGRVAQARAAQNAPAGLPDGWEVAFVGVDEIPGRATGTDPVYRAIANAIASCPKGKAVKVPVPPRLAKSKHPAGAVRSAVQRMLDLDGFKGSISCRERDGTLFVLPIEGK